MSDIKLIHPVKLVVWDLDDTFWHGTLSEETIKPVIENIQIVKALAERGIVSSICSKNKLEEVRNVLREMGVWDYFVFPQVNWSAKGPSIKNLLQRINLRPENVLFIDDNEANLGEAAYYCPGIQCSNASCINSSLLDLDFMAGSKDQSLVRLQQYKGLEKREESRNQALLSETDFLRQSEIEIDIRYDIEVFLPRILELLERSNQLNFTKKRLHTERDREDFYRDLSAFGFKAGVVLVRDKYCDYGLSGFFMTLATLREYRCEHFVFSCRIMNMGVEQYIYEYLNCPQIDLMQPLAYGLKPFESVDWIRESRSEQNLQSLKNRKLLLVGGCDMLQVSTYCSPNSVEFTNREANGLMVRFDDPFFFLSNPDFIKASTLRSQIPAWQWEDMVEFENHIRDTEVVILSFYQMMAACYFKGTDGFVLRFDEDTVKAILSSDRAMWFVRNFSFLSLSHEKRQELIRLAINHIVLRSTASTAIFVFSENVRRMDLYAEERELRFRYNEFIRQLSQTHEKITYLDVNIVTSEEWIMEDGWHMTRQGYFEIAQAILKALE